MRLHIHLDDELVSELDKRVGPRGRSAFVTQAVQTALEEEARWALIQESIGSIPDTGHDWDADPADWVTLQRTQDRSRTG